MERIMGGMSASGYDKLVVQYTRDDDENPGRMTYCSLM